MKHADDTKSYYTGSDLKTRKYIICCQLANIPLWIKVGKKSLQINKNVSFLLVRIAVHPELKLKLTIYVILGGVRCLGCYNRQGCC